MILQDVMFHVYVCLEKGGWGRAAAFLQIGWGQIRQRPPNNPPAPIRHVRAQPTGQVYGPLQAGLWAGVWAAGICVWAATGRVNRELELYILS